MERKPEFSTLMKLYQQRTGQNRDQAVNFIGSIFEKMNIDPEKDLDDAVRTAGTMATILEMFPDTPASQGAKKTAMDVGMAKVLQKATGGTVPEERMIRMMEAIMPWMAMGPLLREMAKMSGGGGDDSSVRQEFEAFKAEFRQDKRDKALEERFARIEALFATPPPEDTGAKFGNKIDELKDAILKKSKDEQLSLLEKQGADLRASLDGIKEALKQPPEKRDKDPMDQLTEFAEKQARFFEALDKINQTYGYSKTEDQIKGEDKMSKLMKFGKSIIKEVGDIAKTVSAPAPPRDAIITAPLPPPPAPPIPETAPPAT